MGVMDKQTEYVLRTIEERDIRFVRLWFTDVLGILKSVSIAPAELEGAFAEGIGFDGSAIEGFSRVYGVGHAGQARPLQFPDPAVAWRRAPVARLFCDILLPDGSPSYADPRWVLKRQLAKAAQQGFTFYTHPEIEFFLFNEMPGPNEEPVPVDNVGYFDHSPHPAGQDFRRQPSRRWSTWASQWSSPTTRVPPGSRRSTCATPTH
jgi:glutamine synthetase